MRRRRLIAIGMAMLVAAFAATAADVRDLLAPTPLWEQTPETFVKHAAGKPFRWLSTTSRDAARCPPGSPLQCFGLKVWEAVVRFADGRPANLEISLYNRGDAETKQAVIDEDAFNALIAQACAKLDEHVGAKGSDLSDQRLAGKAKLERRLWAKDQDQFILKWSGTGRREEFRAEFLTLEISRFDPKADPRKSRGSALSQARAEMLTPDELKAKVTRKDDGAVYIAGVPMVDQGQKGYCAVATAERILRHYGTEVDQHVIAQLADSSAGMGTNPVHMLEMLKKAGIKFGVKVKDLYGTDFRKTIDQFNDYNQFAKKAGKRQVGGSSGGTINLSDLYSQVDPEAYMEFRTQKCKRDYKSFLGDIHKYVDQGVPLAWGVHLGIYPEKGVPQSGGGHMRLIIGYNDEKQEIVYSDSWGARHEFKTMSMDQAWAITSTLSVMTTRKSDFN